MRKFLLRTLLFICCSLCFSQSLQNKFIKGNIADKTTAVMDASDKERLWLTNEAIQFVIKNAEYLGEDRDLEGLALAAILSLPNDYGQGKTESEKEEIMFRKFAFASIEPSSASTSFVKKPPV